MKLFARNAVAVIMCSTVFLACVKKKELYFEYYEDTGSIFSTSYTIKYRYTSSLRTEIEKQLAEFDNSLNPFKTTSIITMVNENKDVVLDSLFINVFNRSREVSEVSDGLFDITVSPLINAWGFGFKNMENVNQQVLDSLSEFVGYNKIRIENNRVVKSDKRVSINMSAIAKGYSSDVIANLLDSYGIEDYMVEIGGEVSTKGVNAKRKCWRIEITKPLEKNTFDHQHEQTIVELCNKSLATSGDFYKYYIKESKKYAHTINPRTSHPSENNTLSATVIAEDCMSADAFATVFMLADTATVRRIAADENLTYMLILGTEADDFVVVESADFEGYIAK